eukprot:TRINITY_DN47527_c0_g1_i1.p2 TRINITY_DN47527_c0_g1~~TRINITY_DN47527_c0_g1_i1.p2  ORF type:complete len:158 (+),score=11.42 TRINITY_DN47527_c0_g1_i1:53-526(+)
MSLFVNLFVCASVYISLSGAYRLRLKAGHRARLGANRSNASQVVYKGLEPIPTREQFADTRDGSNVCGDVVGKESEMHYYGNGQNCPSDLTNTRCGCKIGCSCRFAESCYTEGLFFDYDENAKRLGQCFWAMWAIGLVAVLSVLSVGVCVMLLKLAV